MKASYHGHTFDVDSVIGKDGMEYPAQDVVLIEPDWSSFRREAAKEILASLAASGLGVRLDLDPAYAVKLADELIKQLKEDEK